jgi:signal transduction histidine kinase
LFVCALGVGVVILRALEREFEEQMKEDVEMVARALRRPVGHALRHGDDRTLKRALEVASQIGRVYGASLYGPDGKPVQALGTYDNRRRPTNVEKLAETTQGRGRYGHVRDEAVYSYFVPVEMTGNRTGLLEVTRRKEDINRLMAELRWQSSLLLAGGVLVITAIVLFGYRAAVGAALESLRQSIQRVQSGDVDHRAELRGPQEVGTITEAFNAMLDSIREAEKRLESERKRRDELQARLAESEKFAAVGQLAAGIAHELGTPLATVRGRVQRALRSERVPEEMVRELRGAADETLRIERLVRQVLDYSREESGNRTYVSADRLAAMAVAAVHEEADMHGARIEIEDGPVPAPVFAANLVRAEQALVNLLRNALQAAGQGGHVKLRYAQGEQSVVYEVTDDGPGVPDEIRPYMFDPFFTTKRDQDGTGLGLGIVQAVAREHGGQVRVSQLEERGAKFELFFPSHPPRTAELGTVDEPEH